MTLAYCGWDYCDNYIDYATMRRCAECRDMEWWEEYLEHVKRAYAEGRIRGERDLEDAIETVLNAREEGGPCGAVETLERDHGLAPAQFGERFEDGYERTSIQK